MRKETIGGGGGGVKHVQQPVLLGSPSHPHCTPYAQSPSHLSRTQSVNGTVCVVSSLASNSSPFFVKIFYVLWGEGRGWIQNTGTRIKVELRDMESSGVSGSEGLLPVPVRYQFIKRFNTLA